MAVMQALNPAGGISGGEHLNPTSKGIDLKGLTSLMGRPDRNEAPKAYMNYQLFDPSFNQRYTGHVQVTKAAAITEENPNGDHEELQMEVIVDEPGYMFTYLSHEEETNTEIYFDDYSVEQSHGYITQVQDYYPYGMVQNQNLVDNELLNRYLYQGKEYEEKLGVYDFHARMYDPSSGRFMSVDPYARKFANLSPYNGMGNNPISMVDPTGGTMFDMRGNVNYCYSCDINGQPSGGGVQGTGFGAQRSSANPFSPNHWSAQYRTSNGISRGYGGNLVVNNNNIGQYGGHWFSNDGYRDFNSSFEASLYFADYNSRHNSWGQTVFRSYNTFADSYNNAVGTTVYLPEMQVNTYGPECYDCNEVKGSRNQNGGKSSNPAFGHSVDDWVDVAAAQLMIFATGFDVSTWEKPKYMRLDDFKAGQTVSKGIARRLSVAGAIISVSQAINNPTGGNMVDATFGVIGAIPHPVTTGIGGAYFAIDLFLMGSTGNGISGHIDSYIWITNPAGGGFIPITKIPGK